MAQNPEQFEAIRDDPEALLGSVIEEQLRYSWPIQAFYRTATADYRVPRIVIVGAGMSGSWRSDTVEFAL